MITVRNNDYPYGKLSEHDAPGMKGDRSRISDGQLRSVRSDATIGNNKTINSRANDLIEHLGASTTIGELRELFNGASLKEISMMSVSSRAAVLGIGFDYQAAQLGAMQGVVRAAAVAPKDHQLTTDQLRRVAGPYPDGVGIKGTGHLKGELRIRDGRVEIVTGAKGSRSEVSFKIDVPVRVARQFEGQSIDVKGDIEKKNIWFGTISGAKITSHANSVRLGTYHSFEGTVRNLRLMGPGGEAPPSGSYLELAKPIRVGGKLVKQVFLPFEHLKNGEKMSISGRVDAGHYGGVETPEKQYIQLTGTCLLNKGEPRFDGHHFINKEGNQLDSLRYTRPLIMDAPAQLFVPDYESGKVFIGSMGGMLPPSGNPFWGFHDVGHMREPDALDRKQVKFDANGEKCFNAAGKELSLIGETETGPVIADGIATRWFLDPEAHKIYEFHSGGIMGMLNHLSKVMDVGPKAPPEALHA